MGGWGAFVSNGSRTAGPCVETNAFFAANFAHENNNKTIANEVNHTPNTFPLMIY